MHVCMYGWWSPTYSSDGASMWSTLWGSPRTTPIWRRWVIKTSEDDLPMRIQLTVGLKSSKIDAL